MIRNFKKQTSEIINKAGGIIKSRYGLWFLGLISFADSALPLPFIVDPFMIAYMLVKRSKSFLAVAVTVLTSVLGGLVAYIMAAFFIDSIVGYMSLETVNIFNNLVVEFRNETFLLAFLGAVTPLPFTLTALAAGALKGDLFLFLLGAFLGRSLRFGVVGYLVYRLGEKAFSLVSRNLIIISVITVFLVFIYFLLKM